MSLGCIIKLTVKHFKATYKRLLLENQGDVNKDELNVMLQNTSDAIEVLTNTKGPSTQMMTSLMMGSHEQSKFD